MTRNIEGGSPVPRATRAVIHLGALRRNLNIIQNSLKPGTLICAAVKADAYGHGAIPVAGVLRGEGVQYLGVATAFEGKQLRDAGDSGSILLLGPALPEELPEAVKSGLEIMAGSRPYLEAILAARRQTGIQQPVSIHLKVDTGMGRFGCLPEEAVNLARFIHNTSGLTLKGLATHFPAADSLLEEHRNFTCRQADILRELAQKIQTGCKTQLLVHAANSGAVALSPQTAFGMVRPGLALYGYGEPVSGHKWEPVMEFKTRISALKKIPAGTTVSYGRTWTARKDTWIATIPVGYADGYSRHLSNKASVLIKDRLYPLAGTVCMDQCMVSLGEQTELSVYEEVTLFGPDPAGPDAAGLAETAQTIPYEITCAVSPRVPRHYVE